MNMTTVESKGILLELKTFLKELITYGNYTSRIQSLKKDEKEHASKLRKKLVYKVGGLKRDIFLLTRIEQEPIIYRGREYPTDIWLVGLRPTINWRTSAALRYCLDATRQAVGRIKNEIRQGYRDNQGNVIEKPKKSSLEPLKAFIAHEGETKALGKLKAFLDALGVTYLIAEIEPSNGRVVEGQVDWTQGQADFAIILATKGKLVNKTTGKPQMGTNVADELGRARVVFRNRIILLLETGLEAHTNVGGIVRARFMPQSMDKAFEKIVNELKNWGFIKVGKAEE